MVLKTKISCIQGKLSENNIKDTQNSVKCCKCNQKSDVFLSYGPNNYCKKHFLELTEKRVKKFIRKHSLIKSKEK